MYLTYPEIWCGEDGNRVNEFVKLEQNWNKMRTFWNKMRTVNRENYL